MTSQRQPSPPRTYRFALRLALFAAISAPLAAHGGTYRGPGGGGGSGGGLADTVPGPGSGPTKAPTGPPTIGPPRAPGIPGTPAVTGPECGKPSHASSDGTVWQLWWGYNQAAYLDIKGAVHTSDLLAGSDAFFLGHSPVDHARDRLVPSSDTIRSRVVPALWRILDTETDNDIVTGALIALAKIGEVGGRDELRVAARISRFLSDGNQEIAETAAVALGILANEGAIPLLIDLLQDTDAGRKLVEQPAGVPLRTRAFAAYGLGLAGHRLDDDRLRSRLVRVLVEAVDGEARKLARPDLSVACVSSIGLVPLERAALDVSGEHAQPWSSREAQVGWLLEKTEDAGLRDVTRAHAPTAAARLLSGIETSSPLVRSAVATWCSGLERRGDLPRLVEPSVALALGTICTADLEEGNVAARRALTHAAEKGKSAELRRFALLGLAHVASRPGRSAEPFAATAGTRAKLVNELENGPGSLRPWAGLALGALGRALESQGLERDRGVDDKLVKALASARSPRETGALAIACGMRRDERAVPDLVKRLGDVSDDDTRGYLSLALGMIGDPAGLAPVQEVVRSSRYRPELLRQAAISLGLLGDKALVPELIETLRSASSLSAQASIAYGLGAIGDARSITPLVQMLEDTDITPRARAFAAVALGIVADKEPRPWNAKLAIGINYRAGTVTLTDGQGAGILEIL